MTATYDVQVHSLVLLTGSVNPWTSYFHSGIVFAMSFMLPWIYLLFGIYMTRICWPQTRVCTGEIQIAVGDYVLCTREHCTPRLAHRLKTQIFFTLFFAISSSYLPFSSAFAFYVFAHCCFCQYLFEYHLTPPSYPQYLPTSQCLCSSRSLQSFSST